MRPLPIRLRLTVWYSVMFATALLLLSSTSWWMLHRTIDATMRQDLQERIDDIQVQLHNFGPHASPAEMQAGFEAMYRYRDDGKWLQILDQDGRWVYRSPRMLAINAPLAAPARLPGTGSAAEFRQGTRNVRTFSTAILADGSAYSIEVGAAMNKQQILLHRFGLGLLLLTPAVLIAAILAGHIVSRKALLPVASIANEARRITDRNLHQRLRVSAANDELSHLAITLNGMLARIDAGFRSTRDFTANASHELRTPLARLRTEVEIALLSPRPAEEYRETLERLQIVAVDMTALLDSLLILARAEATSDVLRLLPLDLRELITEALNEWTSVTDHLSIDLRSEFDGSDDLTSERTLIVLGDRLALSRLLRIWLDNACKFTPPGGRISIIAESMGDKIALAVDDSGTGIPIEEQSRVFDRFYKVKGDTNKQKSGTGLGLSLAAWIARQHNTSITLTSSPGAGSRFEVSLTRVRGRDQSCEARLDRRSFVQT